MIRPVTLITAGAAILSGLYLYHTKNAVLMIDRKIERIAKDTVAVGEQTRLLHAEWTLLNDPERLRQFSDRHLALKPLSPSQFTSLNDLAAKLPAPRAPEPDPPPAPAAAPLGTETAPAVTTPAGTPAVADEPPAPIVTEEVLPLPPVPVPPPPVTRPTSPALIAGPQPGTQPGTQVPPSVAIRPAEASPNRAAVQAQAPTALPAPTPRVPDVRPGDTRVATVRPPLQGPPLPAPATSPASQPATTAATALPRPIPLQPPVVAAPVRPATSAAPVAQVPTQPTQRVAQGAPPASSFAAPARQQPAAAFQPAPVAGGSLLGTAQRGPAAALPRPTPFGAPVADGGG